MKWNTKTSRMNYTGAGKIVTIPQLYDMIASQGQMDMGLFGEGISSENILLRFSPNNPIHSKLYLLQNTDTEATRVVLGSANLTDSAFSNTKQYEDILVIDNDSRLFNLYYEHRFRTVFNKCVCLTPHTLVTKASKPSCPLAKTR